MEKARQTIDLQNPGDFNQAIMEFGALQCKPVPDCNLCPLQSDCWAFHHDQVAQIPVRSKKQEQRTRYFYYLIINSGKGKKRSVYLRKRTGNDIWKNLFDFPLIERSKELSIKKLLQSDEWKNLFVESKVKVVKASETFRHVLTHQLIYAKFLHIEAPEDIDLPYIKTSPEDISNFPLPRLIDKYLEKNSVS